MRFVVQVHLTIHSPSGTLELHCLEKISKNADNAHLHLIHLAMTLASKLAY